MVECIKCGYVWKPRLKYPSRCPRCLSFSWDGKPASSKTSDRKCEIPECQGSHYGKGYCRKHYNYFSRTKKTIKCHGYEYCSRRTSHKSGYCSKHRLRAEKNQSLDLSVKFNKGKMSYNWNNGASFYKNHSEFKKQRLIKLKATNYLCEDCGEKAKEVHHIDGSTDNHSLENLKSLCRKCHINNYHLGDWGRKSKYGKYTLSEMADKVGCSIATIRLQALGVRKSLRFRDAINKILKESGYGSYDMKEYKCKKCQHTWKPRIEKKPLCCPACKSYNWDNDLKEFQSKEEK